MMSTIATPNGHIVFMGDGTAFATSPNVANDVICMLSTLVDAMSKDLSKFTGLTPEEVMRDFYDECEIDPMNAAYNTVLRNHGHEPPKTLTRTIIESKLKDVKE